MTCFLLTKVIMLQFLDFHRHRVLEKMSFWSLEAIIAFATLLVTRMQSVRLHNGQWRT